MVEIHFGRRRSIGVGFWLGAVFLILAASLFAVAVVDERSRNFEPLSLPITMISGTIKTQELGNDLSGDYYISINLERKFEYHRMECLLGGVETNQTRPTWCAGIPDLIDISWTLYEGTNVVYQGNSERYPSVAWSNTVNRQIGKFAAHRGSRYVLVLDVKRDASELNIADPKLVVMASLAESESQRIAIGVEKFVAIVLALIGGTIVLGRFLFLEFRGRAPDSSNVSSRGHGA